MFDHRFTSGSREDSIRVWSVSHLTGPAVSRIAIGVPTASPDRWRALESADDLGLASIQLSRTWSVFNQSGDLPAMRSDRFWRVLRSSGTEELFKSLSNRPVCAPTVLALTLRGPSGGHCVELFCETNLNHKQWALRAHCLLDRGCIEAIMKAPRSGPRRAPGGSVREGGSFAERLEASM